MQRSTARYTAAQKARALADTPGATPEALAILERALVRGNVNDARAYLVKVIANLSGSRPPILRLEPAGRPSDYRGWNARSLRRRPTLDEATASGEARVL